MFHQTPNYLSALPIPNAEIARIIGEDPLTVGIDKIALGFPVPPSLSDDLWKEVTDERHKKKVTRTAPNFSGTGPSISAIRTPANGNLVHPAGDPLSSTRRRWLVFSHGLRRGNRRC